MTDSLGNFIIHKTEEQDNVEWLEVISNRNRLLALSDWTQLKDSNLTEDNISEWAVWREKLRCITKETFNDKQLALNEIEALEKIKPIKKTKTFSKNIEDTRAYVIKNLHKKYNDIKFKNLNIFDVENLQLIIDECIEYIVSTNKNINDYTLLPKLYELHKNDFPNITINEYIDYIFNMQKTLKNNIIKATDLRLTYYNRINKCNSVKKLYELDKEINGYRY